MRPLVRIALRILNRLMALINSRLAAAMGFHSWFQGGCSAYFF
jgi:hypothetical protein